MPLPIRFADCPAKTGAKTTISASTGNTVPPVRRAANHESNLYHMPPPCKGFVPKIILYMLLHKFYKMFKNNSKTTS